MTTQRGPLFVVGYVVPTLGMERVMVDLLAVLPTSAGVEAVAVGGPEWSEGNVRVTSLGHPLSGPRRLLTLVRLWRNRTIFRDRTVVLVGVWTALPFLLMRLDRRCHAVVWEHSLSAEKIATSRSLRLLASMAARVYPRADRVVCVSEPLEADVRELSPESRTTVVPNMIGPELLTTDQVVAAWDARRARATTTVVTVGSLTSTKRQDRLIRSLSSWDGVHLVVVGDGPERPRLEALVRELGLDGRVDFTGRVAHDEALALMEGSDVLVHPAAGETFGMVLFEASQLGLPVVAARHPVSESFVPSHVPGVTYAESAESIPDAVSRLQTVSSDAVRAAHARRHQDLAAEEIVAGWLRLFDEGREGGT